MHTEQTERLAAARLDLLTTSTAPPEVGRDTPIECIEPDQLELLTERLLEDWDDPRFSELGLCRAHRLSLVQLRAVAARPSFRAALTHIRALRADRRPDVDARARAMAIDGLCELAQHKPVNATFAQQIRIALQTLLKATAPGQTPATPESPKPEAPPPPDRPDPAGDDSDTEGPQNHNCGCHNPGCHNSGRHGLLRKPCPSCSQPPDPGLPPSVPACLGASVPSPLPSKKELPP